MLPAPPAGMAGPVQAPLAPQAIAPPQQDYGGDMPFPAVKLRGLPFDVDPIAIARFLVRLSADAECLAYSQAPS